MEIDELREDELFIVECLRNFKFLYRHNYAPSELFLFSRGEYSITYDHYMISRKIKIIEQEFLGLDIIFIQKSFFGIKTTELSEIAKFKRPPASLKTLAELVQSDYMYLINP